MALFLGHVPFVDSMAGTMPVAAMAVHTADEILRITRDSLLVGTAFLIVVIVLLIVGYRYKERSERRLHEKNSELESANRRILAQTAVLEIQSETIQKTNDELRARNELLERLIAERNDFLGIAAHDLRNPLGVIRGLAEGILEFNLSGEEMRQCARTMYSSADHMLGLVSRLLEIHTIERPGFGLEMETVDVSKLLARVASMYSWRAREKGIVITVSDGGGVLASADTGATEQVVINLLSNALKFSPRGTTVTLRSGRGGERIRIEVEDQGPGIRDEDREHLFKKFTRLNARPTAGEPSTGLGLAIVKRYVEAMDGRVWCESGPAMGARFIVELPAAGGDAHTPAIAVHAHTNGRSDAGSPEDGDPVGAADDTPGTEPAGADDAPVLKDPAQPAS